NWEHIKDVSCPVPVGEWVRLDVYLTERSLDLRVNGKGVLSYEDRDHPLAAGGFGLRQWRRPARSRNPRANLGEREEAVPFRANRADAGPVSSMWRPLRRGSAAGTCSLDTDRPFVGAQAQRLTFSDGEGAFGVENRGLNRWGLALVAGKPYEG